VHAASRSSSFTVQRRDTSGTEGLARGSAPGPGLYNPSDGTSSTKRNFTAGGGFFADDRHKYLGELDPESLTPLMSQSPGPLYNPSDRIAAVRAPTVAFGGTGPNTIKSVPSLKTGTPGPGAYTPVTQNASLSTKPRVVASQFGVEVRSSKSLMDSSACFHGKVQIDMTHANAFNLSPGPGYNPSMRPYKPLNQRAVIGTAKRFSRVPIIVK